MQYKYKIGFSNQSTGLLFNNLVEDLSEEYSPSIIYTGNNLENISVSIKEQLIVKTLNPYIRKNNISRLFSGLIYIVNIFFRIIFARSQLLFIVSNPPFIGLIIVALKFLFGQRYIILIYDIYPDILVGLNKFPESHLFIKLWRKMNRSIYERSEAVITIGEEMKKVLENNFDSRKTLLGEVIVIPNCADPKYIKPSLKRDNDFANQYNQIDKITIMYSGNFGNSHSFDMILYVAKQLKHEKMLSFFLIGDGIQKTRINSKIKDENITNVTSLPLQDDLTFPKALASADIALISMAKGTEGTMVPSKIYYSMAAGSALIGITNENSELYKIITNYQCGIVVPPNDENKLKEAIIKFKNDSKLLKNCKNNSYDAFIKNYTRSHMTNKYSKIINKLLDKNVLNK